MTQHRSKAFGQTASTYAGYQRGPSPNGALMRACVLHNEQAGTADDIWPWRARFTIQHYQDKGFKSGFFQQWDGEYCRHSMMLDYTPATLESVIDRFQKWCTGGACPYKTVNIQVDRKVVRTVSP